MKKRNWCSKIFGFFRRRDFLGSGVGLNVGGQESYQTIPGALISMAVLGLVIYFIVKVIMRVFDKTSPVVTQLKEYDLNNYNFDIYKSDLLPRFIMIDKPTGAIIPAKQASKLVTFKAKYAMFAFDMVTKTLGEISTPISVVPCMALQNKEPYAFLWEQGFDKGPTAFGLSCLELPTDLTSIIVKGNKFSDQNVFLKVEMYPCSLPNALDCASAAQINNVRMAILTQKRYIDYRDYYDPVKAITNLREDISLMQAAGVSLYNYIKKTVIEDETNFFMPKSPEREFYEITFEENNSFMRSGSTICTPTEINSVPVASTCTPYVIMEWRSSGLQETYTRTYTDLMTAFSDVGGFKELVLLGAIIIYAFYNGYYKEKYIKQSIIPLSLIPLQMIEKPAKAKPKVSQPALNLESSPLAVNHDDNSTANILQTVRPFAQLVGSPVSAETDDQPLGSPMLTMKDVEAQVEANIDEFTDISTVVKELSNWRVLKDIIFTPYQKKLLPLVALETERRRKEIEEKQEADKEKFEEATHNPTLMKIAGFVGETLTYKSAIEELLESVKFHRRTQSSSLEERIDLFILEHVPDLVWKDSGSTINTSPQPVMMQSIVRYDYKDPTERGASGNVSEDNHWKPSPMISPETPSFLPPVSIDNVNLSPQNNLNNQQGMYS